MNDDRECFHTDDVSTCDNQLNSPLLRLPGEIRNRVYEYVFSGSETVVNHLYRNRWPHSKKSTPVHVLATCRQIHHEASSIFWDACIINAYFVNGLVDVEVAMRTSKCARITSLVVNENVAWEMSHPSPTAETPYILQMLPMLRKLYVQRAYAFDTIEDIVEILSGIAAEGFEVEYRPSGTVRTFEYGQHSQILWY